MGAARQELVEVQLDKIVLNPDQPRQTFDENDIKDLANSIAEEGLIQPPVVKPSKEEGHFDLVAGERRIRALQLLGRDSVNCILLDENLDPGIASLIENCCRKDLNPIDEAKYLKKLRDRNKTLEEIGRLTGRTITTILNRMKLLKLPAKIQEMVRQGTLPQVGALSLGQYKGAKGKLLRMAHDLAAGRDVFSAGAKKLEQTTHGVMLTARKLPKSPAGLVGRILEYYGWKANSGIAVAKAFLELSPEEQKEACRALTESSRKSLADRLESLSGLAGELHAVISVQKGWDVAGDPVFDKKVPKKPPERAPLSGAKKEPSVVDFPEIGMPAAPKQMRLNPLPAKAKDFLHCMVYGKGGEVRPNIGIQNLSQRIYETEIIPDGFDLQALSALIAAKERWVLPPNAADPKENEFRLLVAHAKFDSGCRHFRDLLDFLERGSKARDPINLKRIY